MRNPTLEELAVVQADRVTAMIGKEYVPDLGPEIDRLFNIIVARDDRQSLEREFKALRTEIDLLASLQKQADGITEAPLGEALRELGLVGRAITGRAITGRVIRDL
jgi:hypothetical protein